MHGLGFLPTEYVDITEEMEIKKAMCAAHQSQIAWMSDNYKDAIGEDQNFFDGVEIMGRFRGMQCGVKYAEGFRMAYDAFRVVPRRVLP